MACAPDVSSITPDLVTERDQLVLQRDDRRAALELGRAVAAAEVRQRDRSLRVELPVDDADDRLHDIVDDRAPAGRAGDQVDAAVRVVDDRRCHRRARTLARLDAIRDRLAVLGRAEAEIGELVVQEEPAFGHQPAAERVLNRRRERDRVALAIDYRQMRGRRQLDAFVQSMRSHRKLRSLRWRARCRTAKRSRRADLRTALAQVITVEQAARRRHEVRIRHVRTAVGVGEPARLRDEMRAPERRRAHGLEVVRLEHREHLQHRRSTRRRERHAADAVAAIRSAHRRAHLHAVAGKIVERQVAGRSHRRSPSTRHRARSRRGRTLRRLGLPACAACAHSPDCEACRRSAAARRRRARSSGARDRCRSALRSPRSQMQAAATPGSPAPRAQSPAANRSAQRKRPCARCAAPSNATVPGTPTERPPITASMNRSGLPSRSRKRSGFAAAGAVSRPSYARSLRDAASCTSMKPPPPIPDDCGSTRPSTSCAAIAASTALPPRASIACPAPTASGFAAAIMNCRATTGFRSRQPEAPSGAGCAIADVCASSATAPTSPRTTLRMSIAPGCPALILRVAWKRRSRPTAIEARA